MEPNGTKILIVDDDKFLLGMYSQKFLNKKFSVDIATGSLEALKKLREGAMPDIMLLDVIMPNMDGIDLLKTIRDERLVPNATIIMLTNENQSSQIERAKALNADGYIVKASAIPSEVFDEVVKIYNTKKGRKA
ncbi:MAG TPA: response regulator [Candidatus Paceibacterota bacterium]|nr:response regulator [Candidatus Paceibacterota bacterium]